MVENMLVKLLVLIVLGILLAMPLLMWSWLVLRGPRVGRAIQELGHWPQNERMFWIARFSIDQGFPLGPWIYGAVLIFISWGFRIMAVPVLISVLIDVGIKLFDGS
jgi:hypothetical protein